jgi:uncharacterized membrane protein
MYIEFVSGAYDFAIFSQAIWLIGQGKTPFSTIMGIHYMGDQMHYIFYPIGWIYRFIVQDIRVLIYLQAGALAFAALPIYAIARYYQVDRSTAVLIAGAYLLSPIIWFQSISDFHSDVFIVPALLTAYWMALERRWVLFAAMIWLALSSKFLFAVPVFCFGVFLLLDRRFRIAGLALLGVAIAHFIVTAEIIMPMLTASEQANIGRFGYLGSSIGALFVTVITKPWIPLSVAFDKDSLYYYLIIFTPLLPFFWLRLRSLVPLIGAAGTTALNALSLDGGLRTLNYHYQLPITPFIYIGLIWLVRYELPTSAPVRAIRMGLLPWALLVCTLLYGPVGRIYGFATLHGPFNTTRQIVAATPPSAAVLTDHKLATQLSMRESLYLTDWTISPYYDIGDIDFIALDVANTIRSGGGPNDMLIHEARRLLAELGPEGPAERIAPSIPDDRKAFLAEAGCADSEGARRAAAAGIRNRVFRRQPWSLKKDFSTQVAVDYDPLLHLSSETDGHRFNIFDIAQFASMYSGKFLPCVNKDLVLQLTYDGGVRVLVGGLIILDDWQNKSNVSRKIAISAESLGGKHFSLEYRTAHDNLAELDAAFMLPSGAVANAAWLLEPHRFVPVIARDDAYLLRRVDYGAFGVKSDHPTPQPLPYADMARSAVARGCNAVVVRKHQFAKNVGRFFWKEFANGYESLGGRTHKRSVFASARRRHRRNRALA